MDRLGEEERGRWEAYDTKLRRGDALSADEMADVERWPRLTK